MDRTFALVGASSSMRISVKSHHVVALALAFCFAATVSVALSGRVAMAQESISRVISTTIPESIRFIFDLPWCQRWQLSCLRCESRNGDIVCERTRSDCEETFQFYSCAQYNLPEGCVNWQDGCNLCVKEGLRMSCTLRPCKEQRAPNKPTFTCLRYESR